MVFSPPRSATSPLDLMAEAVQAREPAPLLQIPRGGKVEGGGGSRNSSQGPSKKPRV